MTETQQTPPTYEPTGYKHIVLRYDGQPVVEDKWYKLRFIAIAYQDCGKSVAEIQEMYTGLTPGEIHSALAYYYDHQVEMDEDIKRGERMAEEILAQQPRQLTRAELEARLKQKQQQT